MRVEYGIIGNSLGRSEPRENKRHPKVLKLMIVPRKLFSCGAGALFKTPLIRRGQRHSTRTPFLHQYRTSFFRLGSAFA